MNENPFKQRFKTAESSKLLEIIDNPNDYQVLAVESARLELESRKLSNEQLLNAKLIVEEKKKHKTNKTLKVKLIENKSKSITAYFANIFNPKQNITQATNKLINLISIFVGCLFLVILFKEFDTFGFLINDFGIVDFFVVLYFSPLVIFALGGFLFWYRKKTGWILLTIYLSYKVFAIIASCIIHLRYIKFSLLGSDTNFSRSYLFSLIDLDFILAIILFSGLMWIMCRKHIREAYQISNKNIFTVFGAAIGIYYLMVFLFGYYILTKHFGL